MTRTRPIRTGDDPLVVARAEYARGRLAEAEAICRRLLDHDPDQPEALHLLGRLALRAGNVPLAQALLGRALGRLPRDAALQESLGDALRRAGRFEESLACFERAATLQPRSAAAYCRLADAYQLLGEFDDAEACFEHAATLDPADPGVYLAWALALQREELPDEAMRVLRRGLDRHPADAELGFLLAALDGGSQPPRAPDAFLVQHFDRLAPSFDEHLQDRLRYRAPELLVEQLERLLEGSRNLDVLDAGCGTGLCGPLLRPLARRLVGVDLAPRMLEQAASRDVYDELVRGELVEVLTARPATYDLVVATDLCIYFGDLEPLFRAAAGALRDDRLLAFSIERSDQDGYTLRPTARYAHDPEYVRRTAAAVGLIEVESRPCVLRLELGRPVAGLLSIFRKPADDPGRGR